MIDVDHFKLYNDRLGHGAGDEALKAVAAALGGCGRRPADLVARYGGEEFVAVLPDTPATGALHVAQAMVAAVAALALPHPASSAGPNLTVSVGVATGRAGSDAGETCAAADQALYLAKDQGRNRAVLHRPAAEAGAKPLQA